jgi:hypothetical protein
LDAGDAGRAVGRKADASSSDGEVGAAEGVGECDAQGWGADGDVEGLAEGGVFEDGAGGLVVVRWLLLKAPFWRSRVGGTEWSVRCRMVKRKVGVEDSMLKTKLSEMIGISECK